MVVEAEVKEATRKTTLRSECRGLFKKGFDRADIVRDLRLSDLLGVVKKLGEI